MASMLDVLAQESGKPSEGPTDAAPSAATINSDVVPQPPTVSAQAAPAAATADAVPASAPAPTSDGLRFNFAGASWNEVLRWFAEQADLSLQIDAAPAGTVNFSDPTKTYTVSEGLDLINRLLLDRGWAVVRRGRMLLLVDLEADNAEKLISEMAELVTPEAFDQRGNSDIVRCVFPLGGISPDQAREELGQIIGPWGRVNVLAGARQVVVTETIGKLKVIQEVLSAASMAQSAVIQIPLKHRAAEEVLEIARPLLQLEQGMNSNDEIRISVSIYGDQLFATGSPSKLDLLTSIIERADTPPPGADEGEPVEQAAPVLKTHSVKVANLQSVFDVLQTLLSGLPDVRLAIDENRQAIVALGRPETQARIESTISELEGSGEDFAIIDLKRLEPANALLTINKFFGVTEADSGKGPVVDGDPATGRLWVRGTSDQINTVKRLISELENDPLAGGLGDNVRILPYAGSSAIETLKQIENLWPLTGRSNKLRLIVPSKESPAEEPGSPQRDRSPQPSIDTEAHTPTTQQTLVWQNDAPFENEPSNEPSRDEPNRDDAESSNEETQPVTKDYTGDEVVIQLTPAGLVIASRDQEALDLVEQLIGSLGTSNAAASDLPTLFWLKYLKADVAAEIVASVLGGVDSSGSAGSLAENVMGGLGGGMLGGLLGMGGGGEEASESKTILTSRGNVNIVPDNRLNALIIQAPPADMDFIRTVLTEIDREESPETIQTIARPQLIPVIYQEAADVAVIVKAVFGEKAADQQQSSRGGGGGGGGQPRPEDFIAALRGGRGGRGGGEETPKSEASKIIVAVDERSNSLVVTATPQDFEAVRDLVETLDLQGMETEQSVEIIPMGGSVKPEIMQQALESVLGKKTSTASSNSGSSSGSSSSSSGDSNSSNSIGGGSSPEEIQRRIDFFRSRFGGGSGGPPSGFGGSRGGDSGRGGGDSDRSGGRSGGRGR
ncbi:secretin N-terminal domain-containing protein [Neorhodopirellula pilleata]|nr:secretin N-terminal domain-containing protein [Neorhodopirellula pilleata]